jgi:hypothetical protein
MGTRGGLAMRLWALCGHSEKVFTVFLAPHMSIHRQIWAVFLKNWGKFGCEFIVKGESKKQNKTIFQPTRGGDARLNCSQNLNLRPLGPPSPHVDLRSKWGKKEIDISHFEVEDEVQMKF